jgi:hypothetical protein
MWITAMTIKRGKWLLIYSVLIIAQVVYPEVFESITVKESVYKPRQKKSWLKPMITWWHNKAREVNESIA